MSKSRAKRVFGSLLDDNPCVDGPEVVAGAAARTRTVRWGGTGHGRDDVVETHHLPPLPAEPAVGDAWPWTRRENPACGWPARALSRLAARDRLASGTSPGVGDEDHRVGLPAKDDCVGSDRPIDPGGLAIERARGGSEATRKSRVAPLFSPDPLPDPVDGTHVSGSANGINSLEQKSSDGGGVTGGVTGRVIWLRRPAYTPS